MSYTKAYTLWCDRQPEGCVAWITVEDSLAAARRTARSVGWEHKDGRDLCAGHKSEPEPYHANDGARLKNVRDWEPWQSKQATGKVGECSYCGEAGVVKDETGRTPITLS